MDNIQEHFIHHHQVTDLSSHVYIKPRCSSKNPGNCSAAFLVTSSLWSIDQFYLRLSNSKIGLSSMTSWRRSTTLKQQIRTQNPKQIQTRENQESLTSWMPKETQCCTCQPARGTLNPLDFSWIVERISTYWMPKQIHHCTLQSELGTLKWPGCS